MKVESVKLMIMAQDMNRAIHFWSKAFGFRVQFQDEHWSELDMHHGILALHGGHSGAVNSTGLSIQVDSLAEAVLAVRDAGGTIVRDPETYQRFKRVVVVHSVRQVADLAYREFLEGGVHEDPLIGDEARAALTYAPTVTREDFHTTGRVTDRIRSGAFFDDLGLERGFDPARDRIMLCGSMAMIKDVAALVEAYGLAEGSNAEPAEYVLERAFVG